MIVSVGMVSEGTDIPRLKVCCYLSDVKTELYFRQVLGRIIRVTSSNLQHAWLYALNEHTLAKFAQRVDDDLPEHNVISRVVTKFDSPNQTNAQTETTHTKNIEKQYSNLDELITFLESDSPLSLSEIDMFDIMPSPQEKRLLTNQLSVSNHFREKIFSMFVTQ
jgi:superfamily II DNA or RNA helicase